MLLLGVLQAQAAGAVGAGSFDLLETQVLASSAASVTFSSLSTYAADYQHLQIRMVAANTNASNDMDNLYMRFNADTAANYSHHRLWGSGSSVSSFAGANTDLMLGGLTTRGSSTQFAANVVDILDAFNTNKYKTIRALLGGTTSGQNVIGLNSGSWRNTSAISTIIVGNFGDSFRIGSRFSLYGIKAGS